MFIRATKTRSTADGKPVHSPCFLNVSATRSGSAPCLATDYPMARKNWKEVAAEALLHGHPPLFEAACRPQDIVNRGPEVPRRRSGGRRTQIATVNLDSLENPRPVGCLCLETRSRLHDLASALIVARMIRQRALAAR